MCLLRIARMGWKMLNSSDAQINLSLYSSRQVILSRVSK